MIVIVKTIRLFLLFPLQRLLKKCPYCRTESFKVHSVYQREFISPKGKKTKRLLDKILVTSTKLSSVSASTLFNSNSVKACKSSICDLLEKMPVIVEKSLVTKVCVDDFAFRKRYAYAQ